MPPVYYYEDFTIGQIFDTASCTISREEAIAFAKAYDPQFFHVDPDAAEESQFGGLIVSGWQTAAITMRLKMGTDLAHTAGGLIGLGLDNVRWLKPVYPDDTIQARITITDKRLSHSKPTHGIVQYQIHTTNQHQHTVMTMNTAVWMLRSSS